MNDVIEEVYGDTNRSYSFYGIVLLFMAVFPFMCSTSQCVVFTSAVSGYRCKPNAAINITKFPNKTTPDVLSNKMPLKRCHHDNSSNPEQSCVNGIEYDLSVYGVTTITQWNLVCGNEIYDVFANSMLFLGFSIGSAICGPLSDKYGRKIVIIGSAIGISIFFISIGFASNIFSFAILRMIAMVFNMMFFLSSFTYCSEIVNISQRSLIEIMLLVFCGLSPLLSSFTMFLYRDWRNMVFTIGSVLAALTPFFFLIPESPRWLMTQHRFKCAKDAVQRLTRENIKLEFSQLLANGANMCKSSSDHVYAASDLFKRKHTRNLTLMCMVLWFVSSMVFYGLNLNTGHMAGNPFLNYGLIGLVEIGGNIGILFIANTKFQKKALVSLHLMLAGMCCILSTVLTHFTAQHIFATVITITGKYFATVSFNLMVILTTELYPTAMRSTGLGASSFCGRFGSVIMPFILHIQHSFEWFTMTTFGGLCIASASIALLLPSSKEIANLNTVDEAESYYKKHTKRINLNCCLESRTKMSSKRETNMSSQAFITSDCSTTIQL